MPLFRWLKRQEVLRRAADLLAECCQRLDLSEKSFGKGAREWLLRRRWSHDGGEMRRVIYAAALTAPGAVIEAVHFPPRGRADHEALAQAGFESLALEELVRQKIDHFFARLGNVDVTDVHRAVIAQVERALIDASLVRFEGNQQKAARALGINRNTLHRKMRAFGLEKTQGVRSSDGPIVRS